MTELQKPEFLGDEEDFNEEELAYFKARLVTERDAVKVKLSSKVQQMANDERPADELDQAGKMADQAFLLRLADKERKKLEQIERALRKLADGEYGYCEGTDEIIRRKRLDSRPWTRYSIEHKEELERAKKQGRNP